MDKTYTQLSELLSQREVKPSYNRIRILAYLLQKKVHPTADEVYHALVDELPTLSKTTVYNTMKIFMEKNLVHTVNIEGNEARFDVNIDEHGHFKCLRCGWIYDFDLSCNNLDFSQLKQFQIHEKSVYYKGICPKCLHNKN